MPNSTASPSSASPLRSEAEEDCLGLSFSWDRIVGWVELQALKLIKRLELGEEMISGDPLPVLQEFGKLTASASNYLNSARLTFHPLSASTRRTVSCRCSSRRDAAEKAATSASLRELHTGSRL